ncbi:fatty acid desaturase family protein [Nitrosomonas supralitoralis]|uniref:Fatty acid desaturase n=1 Tax=Nitrosomonas supralitoralis TaxID=2116706 RepID=A0A2P7NWT2_9PROT|nr:fatty acid desaturase [Nitrosomonas supralitoralis]PSJ17885.1 fatty acid desaturase [Nitrosomonas supralitoralis]
MLNKLEGSFFRYKGGLRPYVAAILYCQLAYFGGVVLILSSNPIWMIIGTLFLTHGMLIAAYLIHDCGHNALFKSPHHNAFIGSALNWLTGGCYGCYQDLRIKHMMHHMHNADIIEFNYRDYLARHPIQRKLVEILEWFYIPAIEVIMHGILIIAPFVCEHKKDQRLRAAAVIVVRFSLLLTLFLYSPIAYACYLLAYMMFLTILRFMDAFQHNYDIVMRHDNKPDLMMHRGGHEYEQTHTFSNPISINNPWLNLFTLNFGYHNAHHARPTTPWYELPNLHQSLYGNETNFIVPFRQQLSSFHKNRVIRVMGDESEIHGNHFAQRLQKGEAVGINGVSFLTPF